MPASDIVIDASVFVAASLRDEPHHAEAIDFLQRTSEQQPRIHLPVFAVVEVASALARRSGRTPAARRAALQLIDLPGVTIYGLSIDDAILALDLLDHASLRSADLLYLAVANQASATLFTLDREMIQRGKGIVTIRTPDRWE